MKNLNERDSEQYDDIIGLPHHTSKTHPRMSMMARAAQFAPFAALTGYDAAIEEATFYSESSENSEYSENSDDYDYSE